MYFSRDVASIMRYLDGAKSGEASMAQSLATQAEIEEHYNIKKLQDENVPGKYSKVYSKQSFFEITRLGRDFIGACVGAAK